MNDEQDAERMARRKRRKEARRRGIDRSVPSPCISVCQLDDASGLCIGCLRNVDEIRDWPIMTAEEKQGILAKIETRR